MNTLRIGSLEALALTAVAVGISLAMNTGQSMILLGLVAGCALLIAAFLSTPLSLYILVYSMLLSPELIVGGMGGGATAGRGVTLRFDDFLLVMIGFVWLVKAAIHKSEAPIKRTPLNGPIMFYSVASLFATLMGVLQGHVRPLTGFFFTLKYLEYFFLYFMVVNAVTNLEDARKLITAALFTCFLVSLFAIGQIPSGERASAPFEGETGEPNTLGGYMVFMLAIITGLLITPQAAPKKLPLLILMGTGGLALLATLSRASFLGAAVITVILVLFVSYRKPVLFMLVLVGIIASPWWTPDAVKKRVLYTFTQAPERGQIRLGGIRVDTSTSDRLRSWQASFDVWKKSPVWGNGVTGGPFMDAMYPRVLTEMGLLGIVAFLLLLWTLFRLGWTTYQSGPDPPTRGLALGFLLGLVGLLVHALGSNTFIIVRIMEPFWLFAALITRAFIMCEASQVQEAGSLFHRRLDEREAQRGLRPA